MTTNSQGDLFSAHQAKAEGMARVDRHANPDWAAAMDYFALQTALHMPFFTSDDVHDRAMAAGFTLTTHDNRAMGPVMLRLARLDACIKANRPPIPSRRRSLHASPRTVWQSLVYQPHTA